MTKKHTACPAWIKISEDRTTFLSMPDRAAIVKTIFELSVSGVGGYTIANRLNSTKVPAFGPSPVWDQSTIHNMLCNRATIGEHQPKRLQNGKRVPEGDPIPNFYPAAIDENLFLAAQVARQNNLASGRGRKGKIITNLFRGILTCAYCGGPVKFKSKSNVKSLTCARVLEGGGCFRKAWSYRNFESSFFEFVRTRALDVATDPVEREILADLEKYIQLLSNDGADAYGARLSISIALRSTLTELRLASAGPHPSIDRPSARIRLDSPGRYFEVRLRGGWSHTIMPEK